MKVVAAAAVVICFTCIPMRVDALFSASTVVSNDMSTATLLAPTGLSAQPTGSLTQCGVLLSWVSSQSSVTNRFRVQRYLGTTPVGSANVVEGTTFVDNTNISLLTTYTWKISATTGTTWTSSEASVTRLVTSLCL